MKFLRDLSPKKLKGRICLLRVDLNIKSLDDQFRINSILPTIKYLKKNGAGIIILSHRGRPEKFDKKLSLKPVIKILARKLKTNINFFANTNFEKIKKDLSSGQGNIFALENLRFFADEEIDGKGLAKNLASLGDLFINDAFAVSHRKNASIHAITRYIPSYAGLLMEKEVKGLTKATKNPKKPLIVILGGTKIGDKISIVSNLSPKAKFFLFGSSVLNEIKNPKVLKILKNKKCIAPMDFAEKKGKYFDIGPQTISKYKKIITGAKTIIWNGPVGMSEDKQYSKGTMAIAKAITNSKAFKVIGGGETANFILKKKLEKNVDLLSTGGGAMLDFLAGEEMPGLKVLK